MVDFITVLFDSIAVFLFYIIPIAAVVFFVVSIVRYVVAKNKNKKTPGTYSENQIKKLKTLLIISSAIAGVLVAVIIFFWILLLFMANSM